MFWDLLNAILLGLSPFTVLGVWDRRKAILAKINEWTAPKKEQPKEPTK